MKRLLATTYTSIEHMQNVYQKHKITASLKELTLIIILRPPTPFQNSK